MTDDRPPPADEPERSFRLMLARRLRDARVHAGLSQAELGEFLETTQSAISLYENGERRIGTHLLWECSRLLNRPLSYFLDEHDDGFQFPRGSDIAEMIEELEEHREDIPALLLYLDFLRDRKAHTARPRN